MDLLSAYVSSSPASSDRFTSRTHRSLRSYWLLLPRSEDIGSDCLPVFLNLEQGGEFDLLGQDELSPSTLENAFKDQIAKAAATTTWTEQETERILLAAARVGQHLFAQNVLANCGGRCVFCG
jgi:putative restriction endonuclease